MNMKQDPILSQINTIHIPPLYVYDIHFNIKLSPLPRPSKWFLSFRYLGHNLERICHFFHAKLISVRRHKQTLPHLHMCKPIAYQRNRSIVPDVSAMTIFVEENLLLLNL